MRWGTFGQTIGEIVMHTELNDCNREVFERICKRFRDEYMYDSDFDDEAFYQLCDPEHKLKLPKAFAKNSKVTERFTPQFWGTGYVIDDTFADRDLRLVFWVGDATLGKDGVARGSQIFNRKNLVPLPD